ncbi:thioredoxin family protein [Egbenema bharatensis]|uniref:thioredoxin family protein n=1 Tax=Egbenema bharatensis TaxID=3463334 RepID=UPI003A84A70D
MLMLKPIESYSPAHVQATQLHPGEQQYFSFLITEAEKQRFGYKPKSMLQCLCHITNQRLILEPQPCVDDVQTVSTIASTLPSRYEQAPFYEIPYDAIQSLQMVRSLNLSTCVRILLNGSSPSFNKGELFFIASPVPTTTPSTSLINGSSDFVEIVSQLLQVDQQLMQQIQDSPVPVLLHFWARGCKPCELFSSVMNDMAEQFKDEIRSIQINLEDDPNTSIQYGVDSVPTVLIFKNGAIVDKVEGAIPGDLFAKVLRRHI